MTPSTTAADTLGAEGFTTSGDDHDGPAFVCRMNGLPTESDDPCITTPPASAYWSFWIANPGQDTWGVSPLGAASLVPRAGSVEAWIFGAGVAPAYAPNTVRASAVTPTSFAPPAVTPSPVTSAGQGSTGTTPVTSSPRGVGHNDTTSECSQRQVAGTRSDQPRLVEHDRPHTDCFENRRRSVLNPFGGGPPLRRRHPHRRRQVGPVWITAGGYWRHCLGADPRRWCRRDLPSPAPARLSPRVLRTEPVAPKSAPRALHPIAWWIWALGLATAASRTTNPLLLCLILAVLAFVVANRRGNAPWARAFKYYLLIALVVVAIRVVFRIVFGGDIVTLHMHVVVTLPHVPLPSWASGVQIGGPVTLEGTISALYDGLRLGTLLCCVGAADTLANPKRALRILPGALYELGAAVVVALSIAPQLVESVPAGAPRSESSGGPKAAGYTRCAASPFRCSRTHWIAP